MILKKRTDNIRILHLIKFLSSLYFYHQVVTLYFQARGLNYVQINLLWGIIVGVQALTEIPTGILADKVGRKFSIIIALFLQFSGEFIFIFADTYLLFVITSIIAGTGFSFLSGSFEAMMYDSLKEKKQESEMQKVAGLNGSFGLAATMIAAIIGGFVTAKLQLSDFINAIVLTAFFVFLSFLAAFFLTESVPKHVKKYESPYILLTEGIKLIKHNKAFRKILILSVIGTPFINYLLNFYPPYFVEAKVDGYVFGFALAVSSLLAVFTSKYAYMFEKLLGIKRGIFWAVLLPGLFYFLLSSVYHPVLSIIIFVFAFGSMYIQKPIFSDYLNMHIKSKNRATVLSLINIFSGIYITFMGIIIGIFADTSLSYSFLFMGIIITAGAVFIRIDESHIILNSK